jgi:hypothetical protein
MAGCYPVAFAFAGVVFTFAPVALAEGSMGSPAPDERPRRAQAEVLLAEGLGSVAAGLPLVASNRADEAYRMAGGVTLGFGAVNVALAAVSLVGLARDARRPRSWAERVAGAHGEATAFAVNTGLDVLYLAAAGVALAAEPLKLNDPTRWQASGAALAAQGAFLLGFDIVGWSLASAWHGELLRGAPVVRASPAWFPLADTRTGGFALGVAGSL